MIYETAKSFNSSDPFKVAEEKGIYIVEQDLGEIYGFYTKLYRQKLIFLNNKMSLARRVFSCAHELGHAILHPDEVTPKLSRISITSNMKIEREANEFATHFLMDGSHKDYYIDTVPGILNYYGLPEEMARFVKEYHSK